MRLSVRPLACVSVFLSVFLCLCMFMLACLSGLLCICLFVCLYVKIFVCMSIRPSVCVSVYVRQSLCPSVSLYVCVSVCQFVCLSVSLNQGKEKAHLIVVSPTSLLLLSRDLDPCCLFVVENPAAWGRTYNANATETPCFRRSLLFLEDAWVNDRLRRFNPRINSIHLASCKQKTQVFVYALSCCSIF